MSAKCVAETCYCLRYWPSPAETRQASCTQDGSAELRFHRSGLVRRTVLQPPWLFYLERCLSRRKVLALKSLTDSEIAPVGLSAHLRPPPPPRSPQFRNLTIEFGGRL